MSFDPNEFQVQSPSLPQDQILSNIRNFTLDKQSSAKASAAKASGGQFSTPIASYAQEPPRSPISAPLGSDDLNVHLKSQQSAQQEDRVIMGEVSANDDENQLLDELEEHSLSGQQPPLEQRKSSAQLAEQ